jgi:hypothetical protein
MPTRKHNKHPIKEEAIIPTKEEAYPGKKPLTITQTAQTDKPRINALSTAGKKKKPK